MKHVIGYSNCLLDKQAISIMPLVEEKKWHGSQGTMSMPSNCLVFRNVSDNTKAKVCDFLVKLGTNIHNTCDNGQGHHCHEFSLLLIIIVLLSIVIIVIFLVNMLWFLIKNKTPYILAYCKFLSFMQSTNYCDNLKSNLNRKFSKYGHLVDIQLEL